MFFFYRYLLVDFGLAQQCTEYNAKNLEAIKTNAGTTEIQSMKRKRSDEVMFHTNAISNNIWYCLFLVVICFKII